MAHLKLLTTDSPKTMKGEVEGYLTAILYLAPSWLSGHNVCPMATAACIFACLNSAGRGAFTKTQAARLRKTHWFFNDREAFMAELIRDIEKHCWTACRAGLIPVIRLNGTSDIRWETVEVGGARNIFELYPDVQFYDYTKIPNRRDVPTNYSLTFSLSESNDEHALKTLELGANVAVVFDSKAIPETFMGFPVFNGDQSDLRFLDPTGHVIGLYAKGKKAKNDTSGFVRRSLPVLTN